MRAFSPSSIIIRSLVFVCITVITPLFCHLLLHARNNFQHLPSLFRQQDSVEVESRQLLEDTEPSLLMFAEEGIASWYGPRFHGKKTASGERYNMHDFTAAHPNLPFGTLVRVTNLVTQQSTLVRINDRGPYKHGRIIDLSYSAAKIISVARAGIADVKVEIVQSPVPLDSSALLASDGNERVPLWESEGKRLAFSADIQPLLIQNNRIAILHKTSNLREALKRCEDLRRNNKQIYLTAAIHRDATTIAHNLSGKTIRNRRERILSGIFTFQYQIAALEPQQPAVVMEEKSTN